MSDIYSDLNLLHPKFRAIAYRLKDSLLAGYKSGETKTFYQVFETFRSPVRQADLIKKGTTKAGPFESAHQFGLAVDFVPYIDAAEAAALADKLGERVFPGWNWHSSHDWDYLRNKAKAFSLVTLTWDAPHVQHPDFGMVSHHMRAIKHMA